MRISLLRCKLLTKFGIPKEIQSGQGCNFTCGIFQQAMHHLGIKHVMSSAYHPHSHGALEICHQTLETMIKAYCFDNRSDWDEGIRLLLFAATEVEQESLGFSPFELLFSRTVRGPFNAVEKVGCKEQSSTTCWIMCLSTDCTQPCDTLKDTQVK